MNKCEDEGGKEEDKGKEGDKERGRGMRKGGKRERTIRNK